MPGKLTEILDEYEYRNYRIPKHWGKTSERKSIDQKTEQAILQWIDETIGENEDVYPKAAGVTAVNITAAHRNDLRTELRQKFGIKEAKK